jgi:hypothetical protein
VFGLPLVALKPLHGPEIENQGESKGDGTASALRVRPSTGSPAKMVFRTKQPGLASDSPAGRLLPSKEKARTMPGQFPEVIATMPFMRL